MIKPLQIAVLISFLFIGFLTNAQEPGSIEGNVKDEHDEAAIGAIVEVIQNKTVIASATSDYDGNYSVSGLQPGKYEVITRYAGYRKHKIIDVVLDAGKGTRINIQLTPGKLTHCYTITCPRPIVPGKSVIDADYLKHFCY